MKSFKTLAVACCCFIAFSCFVVQGSAMAQSATVKPPAAPADQTAEGSATKSAATPAPEPVAVELADGQLSFSASGNWEKVKPRSRILEAELKIPAVEGDQQDGRLTIMGAGGSIDANIQRWEGQFTQPDGSATEAKTEVETISDTKVSIVDISGTFGDSMGRGPFAGGKKVERADYRMLAAIVETKTVGNYFVKLIGPQATIEANKPAFEEMIRSLKVK